MLSRAHGRAAGQNKGRPELADIFRQYGRATARRIDYRPLSKRSCGPLRPVARLNWEGISSSATLAALSTRLITPAVTATAPNASPGQSQVVGKTNL